LGSNHIWYYVFGILGRITEIGFNRNFLFVCSAYRSTILGTQYLIIDQPDNRTIRTKAKFAGTKKYWEAAIAADTISAYEEFLKSYPDSEFAREARSRLKELSLGLDWKNAKASDSISKIEVIPKDPKKEANGQQKGTVTDIDGNVYNTVNIGTQVKDE